jgi:uncharacterized protein (TIGR01370 family)
MQHIKFFLWLLPSVLIPGTFFKSEEKNAILFCYGKFNTTLVKNYDQVILEPLHFNSKEIKQLKKQNKQLLAYISLGEVNSQAKHYKLLKNKTLGKNNNWDSYYLDLKSKETKEVLLQLMKDAFDKGFDGMFLDNIDNFTQFGPQKNDKKEIIAFLKLVAAKFPNKVFFQNAGLEMLDSTYKYIDGVVVESVASSYTFKDKKYALRNKQEFESYINRINLLRNKYKTRFILVEYADTKALHTKLVQRLAKYKIDYFIGKIDLQTIPNYKK